MSQSLRGGVSCATFWITYTAKYGGKVKELHITGKWIIKVINQSFP